MRIQIPETVAGKCRCLALVTVVVWLLMLVPAHLVFGMQGIVAASLSVLVCFVPGCLAFFATQSRFSPAAQLGGVVAGTGLRVVFAATGIAIMHWGLAYEARNYLIWLGISYLVSLALETWLLMGPRARGFSARAVTASTALQNSSGNTPVHDGR
jgi:hypothetical protein